MPLDPAVKQMLDEVAAANGPALHEVTVEQAREMIRALAALEGEAEPVASIEERVVPGPAADIPLRIYTPAGAGDGPLPVLVWFHGGGWVIGDLQTAHGTCCKLANRAGAVVVSVDYRLAPEATFPAGPDDTWAALQWVAAHAGELGGDASRLAVGGDSAGGNLAAVTALQARDAGLALRHQLLVYPVTDATMSSASYEENARGYLLTRDAMAWFVGHYIGETTDPKEPRVSPLHADDLAGVAPATVLTAEFDPLRDEGEAYGARLKEAGVAVGVRRYDGMIHGFFSMGWLTPVANAAVDEAADALRESFA